MPFNIGDENILEYWIQYYSDRLPDSASRLDFFSRVEFDAEGVHIAWWHALSGGLKDLLPAKLRINEASKELNDKRFELLVTAGVLRGT